MAQTAGILSSSRFITLKRNAQYACAPIKDAHNCRVADSASVNHLNFVRYDQETSWNLPTEGQDSLGPAVASCWQTTVYDVEESKASKAEDTDGDGFHVPRSFASGSSHNQEHVGSTDYYSQQNVQYCEAERGHDAMVGVAGEQHDSVEHSAAVEHRSPTDSAEHSGIDGGANGIHVGDDDYKGWRGLDFSSAKDLTPWSSDKLRETSKVHVIPP